MPDTSSRKEGPTNRAEIDRAAVLERAATFLAHDGDLPFDPAVPPIFQTSLFSFRSYREMEDAFSSRTRRPVYGRGDNPTVMELEKRIAGLEGAEEARAFSSGMGAISATLLAFLQRGDRVLSARHIYGDTFRLFQRLFPRFGIEVEYVDATDVAAVVKRLPGARILYLESPSSMVFELQDLPRLAALARSHGATRLKAWMRIILPLTLPGMAATIGFVFTAAWSELLFVLMLIDDDNKKTFAVGLLTFIGNFDVDWGQMMTASMLGLIPDCLFFVLLQRYLVAGLSAGAVKG